MIIIEHRINTPHQLASIPKEHGAEIDVRYHHNELILHHDPFQHHLKNTFTLESFLKSWNSSGPLILNIKSEGIEKECIELMNLYKISNWFFLDLSMPYFVKYAQYAYEQSIAGFTKMNLAVRYSDREPIDYALSFKNHVGWVWVDCFKQCPLNEESFKLLKEASLKICLVSPELQNHSAELFSQVQKQVSQFTIDAICTKFPQKWKSYA